MEKGRFLGGDYEMVPVGPQDNLVRGAVYEVTGTVSAFMMQVFPENWIERGVEELYELRHSDITVTAVQLNPDGSFRMQVTPNNIQMAGIGIAAAIVAGVAVSILAGMKVEQIWRMVRKWLPGAPDDPDDSSLWDVLPVAALAGLAIFVYLQYKKAGGS